MNSPKYTVKEVDSTLVLFVNNKPSECPFKTGLAGLDGFQRPLLIQPHCNSQCPHFVLSKQSPGTLILHCSSVYNEIKVSFEPTATEFKIINP